MRLMKGITYTTTDSDLAFLVLKVRYRSEEYTKVMITLFNKSNNIVYETRKTYKLMKDKIDKFIVHKES